MDLIKKFICCHTQSDVYLEMRKFDRDVKEKALIKFLEKNNINAYFIEWETDNLPCKIEYLFDKIKEDIGNIPPERIDITISFNRITITYDDNPFGRSTIFFNNFD